MAHKHPVELYYCSVSIESQAVHCCLLEKSVECQLYDLDCGGFGRFEHLEAKHLKAIANGSLPALVHNGHPVLDADMIIGYIDSVFQGPPLLPQDPEKMQSVVKWLNISTCRAAGPGENMMTLGHAVAVLFVPSTLAMDQFSLLSCISALLRHPNPYPEFRMLLRCLSRPFVKQPKVPPKRVAQAAFAGVNVIFRDLEAVLSDGREYVAGPFSVADIFIAANLNRLELLGVLEPLTENYRNLREYWSRLKRRKSFMPSLRPPADKKGLRQVERLLAAFRKEVGEKGVVSAYKLDEDNEEEEEDS